MTLAGQQWEIPRAGVGRRGQNYVPHPVETRWETGLPQRRGRRHLQGQDASPSPPFFSPDSNLGPVTVLFSKLKTSAFSSAGVGRVQREVDRCGAGQPGLLEDPSALRPQQESGV